MVDFCTDRMDFESHDNQPTQYVHNVVPCKVLAFSEKAGSDGTPEICALVHACHYRPRIEDRDEDSVLLEKWRLSYKNCWESFDKESRQRVTNWRERRRMVPDLHWTGLDSIVSRCLVIEEEPGVFELEGDRNNCVVWLVRKRTRWPNEFTTG